MADVLISHSNHLFYDRKQVRKMQPYPPLQAILAAASLREAGFEVALFDSTLEEPETGFRKALAQHRPKLVFLCEDNFNFLTKMCLTRNRELAFFMAGLSSTEGVPVAVAGSDASDRPLEYLNHGARFVIRGEVEAAICEVAAAGEFHEVAGLMWQDPRSARIHLNAAREPRRDLNTVPSPAWDLVDVEAYRAAWQRAHGYFSLNLVASRGCPFRCNWCAKPIYGDTYHTASAVHVAAEMARVKAAYAPDQIWFADDIFALSSSWTVAFAEAVEMLGARVPFKMQSRCDLMTRPTVAALQRAGCAEVWMGAESGSQRVLDAMDKGIRVEQVHRACGNLRAHDIRACLFLQFGYPGETWDDIRQTIEMVRQVKPADVGISVAYPLPGTRFHNAVKSQFGAKTNWRDSDDLSMMFQGAYRSEFYRALRDALHLELSGGAGQEEAWRQVEHLEKTAASANPTVLWSYC